MLRKTSSSEQSLNERFKNFQRLNLLDEFWIRLFGAGRHPDFDAVVQTGSCHHRKVRVRFQTVDLKISWSLYTEILLATTGNEANPSFSTFELFLELESYCDLKDASQLHVVLACVNVK